MARRLRPRIHQSRKLWYQPRFISQECEWNTISWLLECKGRSKRLLSHTWRCIRSFKSCGDSIHELQVILQIRDDKYASMASCEIGWRVTEPYPLIWLKIDPSVRWWWGPPKCSAPIRPHIQQRVPLLPSGWVLHDKEFAKREIKPKLVCKNAHPGQQSVPRPVWWARWGHGPKQPLVTSIHFRDDSELCIGNPQSGWRSKFRGESFVNLSEDLLPKLRGSFWAPWESKNHSRPCSRLW